MHNYAPAPASVYYDYPHRLSLPVRRNGEIQRKSGEYNFAHFTEETNPELALAAQQLQGESYLAAGYITDQDLDEYGRLQKDLDKARGGNVEYVVAEKNNQAVGAVRLVAVPEGGDLMDLPAYEKSVQDMHPEFRYLLNQAFQYNAKYGVREVAGLSRGKDTPPSVLLEMIREIVQQTVRSQSEELWLVTATSNSYDMIQSRFGPNSIIPIGSRVPVLNDGVDSREYLQPSVIHPGSLIENLANSATVESDPMQRRRRMKTLDFMVDGLRIENGEVPQNAVELLENMKAGAR